MSPMKTQMTHIGIGIAALAALAAEGKDFNRTEFPTCLGGCREAARVFGGSPTAPDPIFE